MQTLLVGKMNFLIKKKRAKQLKKRLKKEQQNGK